MLNATKTYMGPVLFLEEDYYVSPDFYHMLRLLYDSKKRLVTVTFYMYMYMYSMTQHEGAVASELVHPSLNQAVWNGALNEDIHVV